MLIRLPHRNADKLWALFFQQVAIICISARRAKFRRHLIPAFRIGVGERDEVDVGAINENGIQAVPIIASTGVTDHGGFQF